MNTSASHSPRNGKIAHFPPVIRPVLNEHFAPANIANAS